jgi:hypothetical protein
MLPPVQVLFGGQHTSPLAQTRAAGQHCSLRHAWFASQQNWFGAAPHSARPAGQPQWALTQTRPGGQQTASMPMPQNVQWNGHWHPWLKVQVRLGSQQAPVPRLMLTQHCLPGGQHVAPKPLPQTWPLGHTRR